MLKKYLVKVCAITLVLTQVNADMCAFFQPLKKRWAQATVNQKVLTAIGLSVAALGGYKIGSYFYKITRLKVENKIEDDVVQLIILSLTLNASINALPAKEREQKFRAKARCINIRMRVMNKLDDLISSSESTLDATHKELLRKKIKPIKSFFDSLDDWRKLPFCIQNPYEKEYREPTFTDKIFEQRMIDSILLSIKPDEECTAQELELKKSAEERKIRILKKVTDGIANQWASKLDVMKLIVDLFCV